jgi:hypothetical protein
MKQLILSLTVGLLLVSSAHAQSLDISIAVRETGGSGPAFSDAGSAGGIEWVNRDGQSLALDGSWQLFSFTPSTDTLLAFAGTTADSILDTEWGSLEHIRILNSGGITTPIQLWIDDVANTDSGGTTSEGFESFGIGSEVLFQEPSFSGSTAGNVLPGSTSAVTDSVAFSGNNSYELDFQFVDDTATRWVRLTTFGPISLQNAAMHLDETSGAPTISFYMRGVAVPEPSTVALAVVGGLALAVGLIRLRRY